MDITAFPKGYLGLVGAQVMGKGISQAADVISPVVELTDLLALSARRCSIALLNPLVSIATSMITIPTGEYWWVRHIGMNITCAAGDTVNGASIVASDPNTNNASLSYHLSDSLTLAASNSGSKAVYPNALFGPGTQFGVRGGTVTGVPTAGLGITVDVLRA